MHSDQSMVCSDDLMSESDMLRTKEELIQELIQLRKENEELRQFEVKEVVELPKDEIRSIVMEYIGSRNHGDSIYPSDIAFEYNLDYDAVEEVMNDLVGEGILR